MADSTTARWVTYDATFTGEDRVLAIKRALGAMGEGTLLAAPHRQVSVTRPVVAVVEGGGLDASPRALPITRPPGTAEEGTQINSAPRVVGAEREVGEMSHLKPDHRWDLGVQPPNLITDPEIFDPSTTSWDDRKDTTFLGVAENVGPNGEDADEWSFDSIDGYLQTNGSFGIPPYSLGFFVRAVSGTIDLQTRSWSNSAIYGPIVTVDTGWQWVKDLKIKSSLAHVGLRGKETGNIYVLRAGLNRGTQLDYSTKTDEPQTFVDVIGGADLQNGSTSGADTNDLKLRAPGGVVSDGDDFTADVDSAVAGEGTWGLGVYLPAQSNLSGVQKIFGNRADGIELAWDEGAQQFVATIQDSGGTNRQATVAPSSPYSAWHDVMLTVSGSDLRLNVGGTVTTTYLSGFTPLTDPHPLVNAEASGIVVRTPEKHPVLTEAEAEAVRQRLATATEDPVPPTERWDLSAESSPHNFVASSQDLSEWSTRSSPTLTEFTDGPVGDQTAYEVHDTSTDDIEGVRISSLPVVSSDKKWLLSAYIEKKSSSSHNFRVSVNLEGTGSSNFAAIYVDPVTGEHSELTDDAGLSRGVIDKGGFWYVYLIAEGALSSNSRVELLPAINEADPVDDVSDASATGAAKFTGVQFVRGDVITAPYVQTKGSIAFPQTAPAQRDNANDLTLGSTAGADTNDPDLVAPVGASDDGDDQLTVPAHHPDGPVTWIFRSEEVSYSRRYFGNRNINGWSIKKSGSQQPVLWLQSKDGEDESSLSSEKVNSVKVFSVIVDPKNEVVKLHMGRRKTPVASIQSSNFPLSDLRDGPVNMLPASGNGATRSHPEVYTRALTDKEALHARQRILNNPDSRIPLLN